MTVKQLRNVASTQPFRPFVLHLTDGRQIAVRHREFRRSPSGRTLIVYQPDDSFNIIDLLLVTDFEFSPEPGPRKKQGRSRE